MSKLYKGLKIRKLVLTYNYLEINNIYENIIVKEVVCLKNKVIKFIV